MSGFFFNDTATTEIYTLSLHDALPIWAAALADAIERRQLVHPSLVTLDFRDRPLEEVVAALGARSRIPDRKSTTSELQSRQYLVCRLLLEKNKKCVRNTLCNQINASVV